MARVWDTALVPEKEQFAFWRDVVWDAFTPVALARQGDGPFSGRVESTTVGPLGIVRVSSEAHSVARSPALVDRDPGNSIFLNLPLVDGTWAGQSGRHADLRSGDFTLIDSAHPFELGFQAPFEQLAVVFPRDLLAPFLAQPEGVTATTVRGDTGLGGVVSATIIGLAAHGDGVPGRAGDGLAHSVAEMVALASGQAASGALRRHRALLAQAALDEVERSLADPELSPAAVASRVGMSVRALHQLFADRGTTFGRWVTARRLERCHRALADPSRAQMTIAQIAAGNGIADPAHFSRLFRANFGVTARQVRADAVAGLPAPVSGEV